jgi:hypothetical protein
MVFEPLSVVPDWEGNEGLVDFVGGTSMRFNRILRLIAAAPTTRRGSEQMQMQILSGTAEWYPFANTFDDLIQWVFVILPMRMP